MYSDVLAVVQLLIAVCLRMSSLRKSDTRCQQSSLLENQENMTGQIQAVGASRPVLYCIPGYDDVEGHDKTASLGCP